jgi:arogenate dehydrogenase (NADP+)
MGLCGGVGDLEEVLMMKIGIIGLGLIGGSLGIDLRRLGHEVLGVSARATTCARAVELRAADQASQDLGILSEADVVFICTPIGLIEATLVKLLPHLAPHTVVTDVGSVKGPMVQRLANLWPNFIGGHPMAGTAESGIEAAIPGLFVNNPYVLTPLETTPVASVVRLEGLVQSLGAKLIHCEADHHDRAVAWISHLPVMVSAGLISACLAEENPVILQLAQTLASSGFRDTSRVGGGNPELGVMMAQYNQQALLTSLRAYRTQIDRTIAQIEQADWSGIHAELEVTHLGRLPFLKP